MWLSLNFYYLYLFFGDLHPFHVSVCDIYYNPRSTRIELVQRIFLDDLEQALRAYADDPYLDIMHPKDAVAFDSLLEVYYTEKIALKVNDQSQSIKYLGHKRKQTQMYSYMETNQKIKKVPQQIHIRNTLLLERFKDQQNLMKIHIGDQKESIMLHQKAPEGSISLE